MAETQFQLFEPKPDFGTETHKLIRNGAPDTSIAAANSVDTRTDEEIVYNLIKASRGRTAKEVAAIMGRRLNCISGRFSALKQKKLIEPTGQRRANSLVMRAV